MPKVFGAIFQYPGTYGHVHDFTDVIASLHAHKAIAVVAADPLSLTLLKSPGEMGADIAIGSMQRFGVPMGYGGPHAAYMAVKDAYKRSMPGPPGRRHRRCARQPGLPAGAADPRAAHPPREGDLEHLHRAGAARRDRLDVCGVPRPGACAPSPAGPHARPCTLAEGLKQLGLHHRPGDLLRHRHRVCRGPSGRNPEGGAQAKASICARSAMTRSALRSTR
jgi:hypothetical protein